MNAVKGGVRGTAKKNRLRRFLRDVFLVFIMQLCEKIAKGMTLMAISEGGGVMVEYKYFSSTHHQFSNDDDKTQR